MVPRSCYIRATYGPCDDCLHSLLGQTLLSQKYGENHPSHGMGTGPDYCIPSAIYALVRDARHCSLFICCSLLFYVCKISCMLFMSDQFEEFTSLISQMVEFYSLRYTTVHTLSLVRLRLKLNNQLLALSTVGGRR